MTMTIDVQQLHPELPNEMDSSRLFDEVMPTAQNESVKFHNMQHHLFGFSWKSNFSAPIEERLVAEGAYVLDVGCGTGSWVLDNASCYPNATFVGISKQTLFPMGDSKPSNAGFLQCNLLNGLPFPDDTFDYVHARFLAFDLTEREWRDIVIPEMIRVTKPGGYVEFMELDTEWDNPGPMMSEVLETATELLRRRQHPTRVATAIARALKDTEQAVDLTPKECLTPIGTWGGDFGVRMCENFTIYAKHYAPFADLLARSLELSQEGYATLIDDCAVELNESNCSLRSFRLYAKKVRRHTCPKLSSGLNASIEKGARINL